jgi:co-chaperonin GroES (HSP10)
VNTTPAAEDDKVLVEAMAVVAEAQKGVVFADNNQDEDASQYVADVVQAKDDEISCGVETVLSTKEVESVLSTKEVQSVASSSPSLFGFNFV